MSDFKRSINLVSIALNAVVSLAFGLVIDPLLTLVPDQLLIKKFVDTLGAELFSVALFCVIYYFGSRVRRIDILLESYLRAISCFSGLLIASAPWWHSGAPLSLTASSVFFLTWFSVTYLIRFLGSVLDIHLLQITEKQLPEYLKTRRDEVQGLLREKGIERGTVELGIEVGGGVMQALFGAVAMILLAIFHFFSLWLITVLNLMVFYGTPWYWAIAAGVIVAGAFFGLVSRTEGIGKAYADRISLHEKYGEWAKAGAAA